MNPPVTLAAVAERRVLRDVRLIASVVAGALVGLGYVAFDVLSETRIEHGTLTGVLASVHSVVDRSSPVIVGVLLGVFVHSIFLRRDLARAEAAASRADALRTRLLKVERDQAIWVLAATVLHELNNPLHALGLLLDEHTTERDEMQRADLIERARAHAGRARQHLATLRSLRGLAEPDVEPFSLGQLVRSLAEDMGALAKEDGISVRAEHGLDVEARGDATYVRTILENLVDNSLCAIRDGGGHEITVRLRAEAERAVVYVVDDGPPIDDEAQGHLFEPLRSTKTHGLGLGLPIARALARAMDGDLTLGNGKSFRLELPLKRSSSVVNAKAPREGSP
jgi:signal transduction histidine kinase